MSTRLRRVTPVMVTAAILAPGCASASHAALSLASAAGPRASGPARAATVAGGFPVSFIGVTPSDTPSRLAVYSASTGQRIKYLTIEQPGGGVGGPALSAGGGTVAFGRGQGTCAASIDVVPAGGGPEQVLIPIIGTGDSAVIPGGPSYSGDGRYLLYDSIRCSAPADQRLHVRNLSTGTERTGAGYLTGPPRAVFVDGDQQVAAIQATGQLTVWQLPSFTMRTHAPPRLCRYQALAGTESELVAALQCGSQDTLSLVSISPATFTITKTLVRLGPCLASTGLSLAAGNPLAMLVETVSACGLPQRADILEISGQTVVRVRAGAASELPSQLLW